jgi:hypothetical protein
VTSRGTLRLPPIGKTADPPADDNMSRPRECREGIANPHCAGRAYHPLSNITLPGDAHVDLWPAAGDAA